MDDLQQRRAPRRRIRAMAAALLVGLCGALVACSAPDKADSTPQTVRIGALMPLTGDNAPTGQRMMEAYQLAIKEINDAGGVLGHPVELVAGDDACDPGTAVVKANELVAKDITVSVGGGCSVAVVPVLKVFHTAAIPMIVPAANSMDLLAPGYDSVFLLAGTAKEEGERAVQSLTKMGRKRLAVVDDGTSFPQSVAHAAVEHLKTPDAGMTLATRLRISQGATSYPRMVDEVIKENADAVLFTGYYPEAATIVRDLRTGGFKGTIMLSDAGLDPTLFDKLTPAETEGLYGITLPLAQFEPKAKEWAARYRAAYGHDPGPFTMQTYDAFKLAVNAIERAGSLDREAVRKAIAATSPADIQLLSGPSQFGPDGTQPHPDFMLLKIHDGAFTLVSQAN
ncbi:branched-chain amino acid ABC transporter substrate-binding protein [Catellatospora tritici]|uniref:branched-chain amino acid ABC transporter substrate-binding protein n=1 Tax=Catellatospora tritici TaxID=2851566 RepID=UPI0027DF1659|nr:branched-chain amino acid ABC transporter substrate-binding protein [Catellatospora tritici]